MCLKKICQKLEIEDFKRFRWFFWLLIIGLLYIIFVFIYKEKFLYINTINNFTNIYRFFWVLPFPFIGFSFLALLVARRKLSNDTRPWISYCFNYFPRLIALSLIIFSVLHLFEITSGYLYYFFSAGIGLYLGYNVDFVKLEDLIARSKK